MNIWLVFTTLTIVVMIYDGTRIRQNIRLTGLNIYGNNSVLRPSAKLKIIFYSIFIFSLSLLSILLIFYFQFHLDPRPVKNLASLSMERESLINTKLVDFYVKSISDEKIHSSFMNELHRKTGKYGNKIYLKESLKQDLFAYNIDCKHDFSCAQIFIPLNDISGNVWRGLIGIEDNRFLNHTGVDWRSIARAFYINLKAGRIVQGGSTLTQQLVKNIFLTSEKTFTRKIKEAFYSIILEFKYTKDELIEAYLNNVYWGSYKGLKIYGIKTASLFYFNKHPNTLSEFEASILIGMLKGPSLYSPFSKKNFHLKKRSNVVFQKLVNEKYFIGSTKAWNKSDWALWLKSNFDERKILLETISKLQNPTFERFLLTFFLEKKINHLRAIYPKGDFAYHAVGINSINDRIETYSKKSILNQPKNIGSLLKPIVYSKLFEKFDSKKEFSTAKITLPLISGDWSPSDHYDKTEQVTLEFALLRSLNIPYIRAVKEYGFNDLESFLATKLEGLKKPLQEYPSQLLGSIELSVGEVIELYQNFFKDQCSNPGTLKAVEILSSPKESTTSAWVKFLGRSTFFGKTGTSNNGYDNWYVYNDGRDLFVVWVGHVGARNIGRMALSGAGVSFDVLQKFLTSRAKNIGQNNCEL